VTTAGSYVAAVTDVGFPTSFAGFNVLVTQGTNVVGSFVNGGSQQFTATAGSDYFITFAAQPATSGTNSNYKAGTYSLVMAAAPSLSFTSDVTHVASGGSATLTWTGQNVSSCTASGGWSGAKNLSDSASTGALTSDTTFTLACTGNGVNVNKSVTITIDKATAPSGGGGGGGAFDFLSLAGIAVFLGLRLQARRQVG